MLSRLLFLLSCFLLIQHFLVSADYEPHRIYKHGSKPTKTAEYAGLLTIDQAKEKNIFYYFFESQNDPLNDPVTLWLNGGPGASSLYGLFCENGPYRIDENGSLTDFAYAWNQYSNLLYIDQPVGTGYSSVANDTNIPRTLNDSSSDLYDALQLFFQLFPEHSDSAFYITGESYAGKYIPSLAYFIYSRNLNVHNFGSKEIPINLKGVAIGNGWVHPYVQNQAYVDYAYNLGLIGFRERNEAQAITDELKKNIIGQDWKRANTYSNMLVEYVVNSAGKIDVDNMAFANDPTNPLIDALEVYLNLPQTKAQLNVVTNTTWTMSSGPVYVAFTLDEQQSTLYLLPTLIANYRVLIYTGNFDLNCNIAGVEAYLEQLSWPGAKQFYDAPRYSWYTNGALSGYGRNYENLTNVVVRNAGHEVPFYTPEAALDMLNRFIKNEPFDH